LLKKTRSNEVDEYTLNTNQTNYKL
jgi:hypothetical protein